MAALLAILQPSRVNAVVASGIFVYCTTTNILPTIRTQSTDTWDVGLRANYVAIYGEETLQSLWNEHIDFCKSLYKKVVGLVESRPDLKDTRVALHEQLFHGLGKIRCPVLLVHGDKVSWVVGGFLWRDDLKEKFGSINFLFNNFRIHSSAWSRQSTASHRSPTVS